jgi:hypothetical protein
VPQVQVSHLWRWQLLRQFPLEPQPIQLLGPRVSGA